MAPICLCRWTTSATSTRRGCALTPMVVDSDLLAPGGSRGAGGQDSTTALGLALAHSKPDRPLLPATLWPVRVLRVSRAATELARRSTPQSTRQDASAPSCAVATARTSLAGGVSRAPPHADARDAPRVEGLSPVPPVPPRSPSGEPCETGPGQNAALGRGGEAPSLRTVSVLVSG